MHDDDCGKDSAPSNDVASAPSCRSALIRRRHFYAHRDIGRSETSLRPRRRRRRASAKSEAMTGDCFLCQNRHRRLAHDCITMVVGTANSLMALLTASPKIAAVLAAHKRLAQRRRDGLRSATASNVITLSPYEAAHRDNRFR